MAFPAVPVLLGASLLGGILGGIGGKGKPIDPQMLKFLFGPDALNEETQKLFSMISTSPYGQDLIRRASLQGGRISQGISARLARGGLAGGGAESGIGSFAAAAGGEAGELLQSQARSGMFSQAMEAAVQSLRDRMAAYTQSQLQNQGQPSALAQIGGSIQGAAGLGLAAYRSPEAPRPSGLAAGGANAMLPQAVNQNMTFNRLPGPAINQFRSPVFRDIGRSLGDRLNDTYRRF